MRVALSFLLALFVTLPATAQRRRRAVTPPPTVSIKDDLRDPFSPWQAGFCDYSPVHADIVELSVVRDNRGIVLSSHNRSDDMFMFLTRKLAIADGIRPNQRYEVSFRIQLFSQVGTGCGGIGGSPGESVYLKAGASGIKPEVVLVQDDSFGHFRLTVDKGNQAQSGPAASVAGNIANNSTNCFDDAPFLPIERIHRHTYVVQANGLGEIWLLVGTDSGFEGKTTLQYRSIEAELYPVP